MRILHLTSHLNVGGVSGHILCLTEALSRRRHEGIIASAGGELEERVRRAGIRHWDVPLHTSVEFSPAVFGSALRLAQFLQREPVDVIHAHTRVGQVVAALLSCFFQIPYVATWHGFFRPNLGRWLWPCTGDRTIAISEPVRQHLLGDFHVPGERIRLIPHGIDVEHFASLADPNAQQRLRQQLSLSVDDPVVGTMSRLVASKGVDVLIRSFVPVRLAIPKACLLIVGDGKDRARLERLTQDLGVGPAVRFAGTLPESASVLSLMDVFVFLPAVWEGFGLSLLEAMASQRPIVAVRRGGGAQWVLEDAGVGLLVEPNDQQGLAGAIVQLLQDRQAATRYARHAYEVVKKRYSLTRMVDAVEAVYDELVSEKGSS